MDLAGRTIGTLKALSPKGLKKSLGPKKSQGSKKSPKDLKKSLGSKKVTAIKVHQTEKSRNDSAKN